MSFTAGGGKILIKFDVDGISGIECVSGYMLRFHTSYRVPSRDDEPDMLGRNIRAKVFVGTKLLGWAHPESSTTFKPNDKYDATGTFCFELFVTAQTIEAIEQIRGGDGVSFKLEIRGECRDSHNYSMQGQDNVALNVNQKDWIDLLKQIKYGEYILFEMPVSLNPDEHESFALAALKRAKEQFYYGHYDEVISNCRKILELVLKDIDNKGLRDKFAGNKKSMSKKERVINIYAALHHLSHLATHLSEEEGYVHFSRQEAVMILGMTGAALSQYFLDQSLSEQECSKAA